MPSSISEQIAMGKALKITNKEVSLQQVIRVDEDTAVLLNLNTVLEKYFNEMQKKINTYQLSDTDIKKYEYRPHLLCYDAYGTVELVPFILRINNMVSEAEFCNLEDGVKLFSSSVIDFINEVILKEKKTITQNRTEIEKDLS